MGDCFKCCSPLRKPELKHKNYFYYLTTILIVCDRKTLVEFLYQYLSHNFFCRNRNCIFHQVWLLSNWNSCLFQKVPKGSKLSISKQKSKQTQFKTSDEPARVKQILMLSFWREIYIMLMLLFYPEVNAFVQAKTSVPAELLLSYQFWLVRI